jgi:sugar lactone lactonase YvrE
MPDQPQVTCVADVQAVLGEGPGGVEREQALYWVDIQSSKVFRLHDGDVRHWDTPMRLCSLVPRATGGFVAGTEDGIFFVDLDSGRFEPVADPEADRPGNRFNDGKVDRAGRFWAGTMDDREREACGTLYRLDADLRCSAIDHGYRITNGPAFSPDGRRMYHSDTARRVTYMFDLDDAGNAANRREFARFAAADGFPDGMTVDAEGCLWVAFWGGWCLRRYSPDAELLQKLELPAGQITSCAFGGKGLRTLYITSARRGLEGTELARQPFSGGLFAAQVGVAGIAEVPFAG